MRFSIKFRPSILIALFLSFCLGSVLLLGKAASAFPPPTQTQPVSNLALTQDVQRTVLDNGLTVLTKEVRTAPVVSVQVWYRIGSRNEEPGVNGIAHQLEHMMFKGTKDRPVQFGRLFSALGSQFNAFTSYDETAYFGTVESDKLEALLILEADRMQGALINAEQLESEKRVVISELQGYENSPGYRLDRAVMRSAFPNRPYGLPVGGTKADVAKFTVEQVRKYYQTYYSPDNAILVITGDFDTQPTLQRVKEIFGKVPKRPKTAPSPNSPATTATVAQEPVVLREPGSATLLQAVYPLPDVNHPDVPAIDIMDVVLSGGRSSRLYQSLVESGLASTVNAYPAELIEPGWYTISVTAAPGQPPAKINQVLQKSLAELRQKGVTQAELDRAKTQLQATFVLENQDITSLASQLGYSELIAGDYRYIERYLATIALVTPADVQRVAQAYLDPAKQTIGFFEPTVADAEAGGAAGGRTVENFSPGQPVDPAELAKYLPPATSATTNRSQPLPTEFKLSNGLRVLLLPDRSLPVVNLSGQIDAGTGFDPKQKGGLASLTAENLMNGTKTKDALALATALEDRGASLEFGAGREGVSIGGETLSAHLPVLIETLADVLQQATFPTDQLELSRQRALLDLKMQLDDPRSLARRVFQQTIYPENHPFHSFPTEESLNSITQQDVASFYQKHYRPDTTTLSLVGDFEPTELRSLLEKYLGQWQANGKAPTLNVPIVPLPKKSTRLNQLILGKAEAVTFLGYNAIARKDPRFYAALVLNEILGGDTLSSRLGTEVRDRQGLTYGIYSAFATGIYPGPFLVQMQTAPGDAQKAIASTIALLKQLRDQGVTESELNTAKRAIASSYPVELANPSNVAEIILDNAVYGLDKEEIRQFPERIEAVTATQVQAAIEELIRPERLIIITAGPGATE
jgi:zinc protease